MIIIRPNMKKKWYEAPDTQVLEVRNEGMICASGDAGPEGIRQDYGDPIELNF